MKITIESKKLSKIITFSRPGEYYIYADTNGQPRSLGQQLCVSGGWRGSAIGYKGEDEKEFSAICKKWLKKHEALMESLPSEAESAENYESHLDEQND